MSSVLFDYLQLCKPKVVILMLLTALVGMYLAPSVNLVSFSIISIGLLGIAFCGGSAAAINHILDRRIDSIMSRTEKRPIPCGRIPSLHALIFAVLLGSVGFCLLYFYVNILTAILTLVTVIGYAIFYTGYLKRATTQNIVIGGLAGAAPPLLGWTAITNHLDPEALLLVLIIFIWTPPHFWALAIHRVDEYKCADIPMLPVVYGIQYTKLQILLYAILLLIVSLLPVIIAMSGLLYLSGALLLGGRFLYLAFELYKSDNAKIAMNLFKFSIIYLFWLFMFLLVDHYV